MTAPDLLATTTYGRFLQPRMAALGLAFHAIRFRRKGGVGVQGGTSRWHAFGSLDRFKATKGQFVITSAISPSANETAELLSKRIVLVDRPLFIRRRFDSILAAGWKRRYRSRNLMKSFSIQCGRMAPLPMPRPGILGELGLQVDNLRPRMVSTASIFDFIRLFVPAR